MATHQCQHCLRKTIEDATEVTNPLLLSTSRCNAEGRNGTHSWQPLSSPGNNTIMLHLYYSCPSYTARHIEQHFLTVLI